MAFGSRRTSSHLRSSSERLASRAKSSQAHSSNQESLVSASNGKGSRVVGGVGKLHRERRLVLIDQAPLQQEVWSALRISRRRLEKLSQLLQRHQEVDFPSYESWLYSTFPQQMTALRDLRAEVSGTARKIKWVQHRAAIYGGSLKRLWRDQKTREANPPSSPPPPTDPDSAPDAAEPEAEEPSSRRTEARWEDFQSLRGVQGPPPSQAARDIYRRLVQYLHPDRGGEWTHSREHLWHEVQQAWAAGDADWLARLEVSWETAHELLSPTAPLSRLKKGLEETEAALRDAERALDLAKASPAWKFTAGEDTREQLIVRVDRELGTERQRLQRQLNDLHATIASWEDDWTRADVRPAPRRRFVRRSSYRTPPVHVDPAPSPSRPQEQKKRSADSPSSRSSFAADRRKKQGE